MPSGQPARRRRYNKALLAQEFSHHFFHIAVLAVDRVVELAHVVIGNLSREFIQRFSHLRMARQHLLPNDRHGLVRREVVAIVFQNEQIQRRDQSVGGISCGEVHLFVLERAGQQAQVHDARGFGEAQAVGCGQALVAVGTLHELVAEAGAPLRRIGGGLGDGLQAEAARVFAADLDGEGVIESESLADLEIETPGVFGLDLVVNLFGIAGRLRFQNRGQCGAGVFGIDIDAAAENRLLADVGSRQIEAALNRQMGFVFDLLGDDFAEDELLGEILGADDDAVGARRTARCQEEQRGQSSSKFSDRDEHGHAHSFGGQKQNR